MFQWFSTEFSDQSVIVFSDDNTIGDRIEILLSAEALEFQTNPGQDVLMIWFVWVFVEPYPSPEALELA